jgi:hypothetical protein
MGRHLEVARDIFIRVLVGPGADCLLLADLPLNPVGLRLTILQT